MEQYEHSRDSSGTIVCVMLVRVLLGVLCVSVAARLRVSQQNKGLICGRDTERLVLASFTQFYCIKFHLLAWTPPLYDSTKLER